MKRENPPIHPTYACTCSHRVGKERPWKWKPSYMQKYRETTRVFHSVRLIRLLFAFPEHPATVIRVNKVDHIEKYGMDEADNDKNRRYEENANWQVLRRQTRNWHSILLRGPERTERKERNSTEILWDWRENSQLQQVETRLSESSDKRGSPAIPTRYIISSDTRDCRSDDRVCLIRFHDYTIFGFVMVTMETARIGLLDDMSCDKFVCVCIYIYIFEYKYINAADMRWEKKLAVHALFTPQSVLVGASPQPHAGLREMQYIYT